ncbi:MAG: hypothetical protein AAF570_04155, partial [Bacteroidota bacterium]
LDSPWWSPAPDEKWTWPLGELTYPLPGALGIGADMEYVIGSGEWPEIQWGECDFSGDKFMTDLMNDHVPSGGETETEGQGSFQQEGQTGEGEGGTIVDQSGGDGAAANAQPGSEGPNPELQQQQQQAQEDERQGIEQNGPNSVGGTPTTNTERTPAEGEGGNEAEGAQEEELVTSESQVTAEDRRNHQRYFDEIEQKLEVEEDAEHDDFDDLYSDVQRHAERLLDEYQPKLRNGINITADYEGKSSAEADGDIVVTFIIAPNTGRRPGTITAGSPEDTIGKAYGTTLTRHLPMAPADKVTFATQMVAAKATIQPFLGSNAGEDLTKVITFIMGCTRGHSMAFTTAVTHLSALNALSSEKIVELTGAGRGDKQGVHMLAALNGAPKKADLEAKITADGLQAFVTTTYSVDAGDLTDFMAMYGELLTTYNYHADAVSRGTGKKWTKLWKIQPPTSNTIPAMNFRASELDGHVDKHLLYRSVHGSRTPDVEEPWEWKGKLGLSVTKSEITTSGAAMSSAEETSMFGSDSEIKTKAGYLYFVGTFLDANNASVTQHFRNLFKNDYKNNVESNVTGGSAAYLHTTAQGDSKIMMAVDGGDVFYSARFDGDSGPFKISSAYIPSGGAVTRFGATQNTDHKLWDIK